MPKTQYSTIQVPRVTKLKIEDFRRRSGYPSNSQAVTALVERSDVAEDIRRTLAEELREELRRTLAKEATSIIVKTMYQIFIDILRNSNKPLSNLKFDEVIEIIRTFESKPETG